MSPLKQGSQQVRLLPGRPQTTRQIRSLPFELRRQTTVKNQRAGFLCVVQLFQKPAHLKILHNDVQDLVIWSGNFCHERKVYPKPPKMKIDTRATAGR